LTAKHSKLSHTPRTKTNMLGGPNIDHCRVINKLYCTALKPVKYIRFFRQIKCQSSIVRAKVKCGIK